MKYIRTKNGVYDETKVCLIADAMTNEIFVEKMIDGYTSHLEKVIAQSYTIEELCDEFILHYEPLDAIPIPWASYERRSDRWNKNKEMLIKELKNTSGRKPIVRGAIYTDKGLIYIAKMNDKGEFELICD